MACKQTLRADIVNSNALLQVLSDAGLNEASETITFGGAMMTMYDVSTMHVRMTREHM